MSTTSETPGPPPAWLGDIALGVEAWVGSETTPDPAPRRSAGAGRSRGSGASREDGFDAGSRRRSAASGSRQSSRPTGQARPPRPPIPADEVRGVAKGILLEQLAGRARSRKELADKLSAKEIPDDVAAELLDRFEAAGFIDDAEFARLWVTSRQRTKKLARRALAQELRLKGVDDEVARAALDDLDPSEEEAAARELVQRKLRSMSRLDDVTKTRRLLGVLGRKGYSGSLAMSVIRAELAGMPESEM